MSQIADIVADMRLLVSTFLFVCLFASSTSSAFGDAPSLREKIGQMILVGFVGDHAKHPWFRAVLEQVRSSEIGGVLYLQRNIRDRTSVMEMNAALEAAADDRLQLLIAVDQEGGKVQRLRQEVGFPATPAAETIAAQMDLSGASKKYGEMARKLNEWGFNFNLAPVVDVNVNKSNPIIGRFKRSFSSSPETVIKYAATFIDAHRKNGVLTALKHFPGHGSSRQDSHYTVADVTDSWSEMELIPFRELISQNRADTIMTAHVRNKKIQTDDEPAPASLSKAVVTDLLRNELNFSGVIVSDDLQMDSIRDEYDIEKAAVLAIRAGTDILTFANDRRPDLEVPRKVINFILSEARTDYELSASIDNSYRRISRLKQAISNEKLLEDQPDSAE